MSVIVNTVRGHPTYKAETVSQCVVIAIYKASSTWAPSVFMGLSECYSNQIISHQSAISMLIWQKLWEKVINKNKEMRNLQYDL